MITTLALFLWYFDDVRLVDWLMIKRIVDVFLPIWNLLMFVISIHKKITWLIVQSIPSLSPISDLKDMNSLHLFQLHCIMSIGLILKMVQHTSNSNSFIDPRKFLFPKESSQEENGKSIPNPIRKRKLQQRKPMIQNHLQLLSLLLLPLLPREVVRLQQRKLKLSSLLSKRKFRQRNNHPLDQILLQVHQLKRFNVVK